VDELWAWSLYEGDGWLGPFDSRAEAEACACEDGAGFVSRAEAIDPSDYVGIDVDQLLEHADDALVVGDAFGHLVHELRDREAAVAELEELTTHWAREHVTLRAWRCVGDPIAVEVKE
jgi:hypothetical protein